MTVKTDDLMGFRQPTDGDLNQPFYRILWEFNGVHGDLMGSKSEW